MKPVRLEDSLAYLVYRNSRLLRRHFLSRSKEAGFDITQEQWFVLNKLAWEDGQSQVDLSDDIFADRPNMTRILATLEKRGLVARRADEEDGRKMRVFLTKQGRALQNGFSAWARKERGAIFEGIPKKDMDLAMRVLGRLEDNLTKIT